MKIIRPFLFCLLIFATHLGAQVTPPAKICTALLQQGIYDKYSTYGSEESFNAYRSALSSYDFQSYADYQSTAAALGFDIPIADMFIGVDASARVDNAHFKQLFQSFATSTWNQASLRMTSAGAVQTINHDLLTVYDHCQQNFFDVALTSAGMLTQVTPQSPPSSFTVSITAKAPPGMPAGISITQLEPATDIHCSMGGAPIALPWMDPNHTMNAVLTCTKDAKKSVAFFAKTNFGQTPVPGILVPAQKNPIDELQEQINAMGRSFDSLSASVDHSLSGLTANVAINALPAGTVIAYYSRGGQIPTGWMICDGTNGTPDLRGRYIQGVASFADVGGLPGNATHAHTFTTGNAFNRGSHYKVENGCCPQSPGLDVTYVGTTDPSSNIPPSVTMLYLMRK